MNKKIMVVDDEPDILTTIGQMLEMSGYEVIKATNGKQCIEKLNVAPENPDLIVLDIIMPEVSGWDIAAILKENPKWNSIPILFLTAKGDTMSIGMGRMTSEDYIVKPFDAKDLILRIQRILEK